MSRDNVITSSWRVPDRAKENCFLQLPLHHHHPPTTVRSGPPAIFPRSFLLLLLYAIAFAFAYPCCALLRSHKFVRYVFIDCTGFAGFVIGLIPCIDHGIVATRVSGNCGEQKCLWERDMFGLLVCFVGWTLLMNNALVNSPR